MRKTWLLLITIVVLSGCSTIKEAPPADHHAGYGGQGGYGGPGGHGR